VNPPIGVAADVLAVFDDGSGPALFVGGSFQLAGGQVAHNIARWDGTSWSALASGTNGNVAALLGDSGTITSDNALFVGGSFTEAGSLPAASVAAWAGDPYVPEDCDGDNDVDWTDFASLFDCLEGPNGWPPSFGCTCYDFNNSGHVDLADFTRFQVAFTGQR